MSSELYIHDSFRSVGEGALLAARIAAAMIT
jgi:hypothetical protein